MDEDDASTGSPLRVIVIFLLIVVLPLAIGLFAAARLTPRPQIGIIRLSYDINSQTAYEIGQQLRTARENPAVKAVVLVINSPGGSAAYSEELFLDVLDTRREMPVIASIDLLAASGAYYMAAAANEIYAKPTSAVGSVGVIASLPGDIFIDEDLLTTGPYKAFGGTRDGYVRQIERAKLAFLDAVQVGRGDRLTFFFNDTAPTEIYTGVQAKELGLIDSLASGEEALRRAAALAGVRRYEAVELYPLTFDTDTIPLPEVRYQPLPIDEARLRQAPAALAPGLYYRYVEPGATR